MREAMGWLFYHAPYWVFQIGSAAPILLLIATTVAVFLLNQAFSRRIAAVIAIWRDNRAFAAEETNRERNRVQILNDIAARRSEQSELITIPRKAA
ncbi:MAG: hypothetical protein ACRDU4_01190 [Mycobacterium sp.]